MKKSLSFLALILGMSPCFSQTTIDFETASTGGLDASWRVFGGEAEVYPEANNPSKIAPNTSDKSCAFVSYSEAAGGVANLRASTKSDFTPFTFTNAIIAFWLSSIF